MRREQSVRRGCNNKPVNDVSKGQGKGQGERRTNVILVVCCFDAADELVTGS